MEENIEGSASDRTEDRVNRELANTGIVSRSRKRRYSTPQLRQYGEFQPPKGPDLVNRE
jgi:hypothetical protein